MSLESSMTPSAGSISPTLSDTIPGFSFPSFDGTLGALFIGSTVSTLLYGVICLQMFIYITAQRTQQDSRWLRLFVLVVFVRQFLVDTTQQVMMVAAMYRYLVTDYMNPSALPSGGAASGEVFTYAQSVSATCTALFIQLFFSWRIWAFSGVVLNRLMRTTITILTVILALFSFGCSIDLAVEGFNHRLLTVNTSAFILAYKLSASSRIAFDVFVTVALTLSLHRSRSGIRRTDHIITVLILFTVNTNLITMLLSVSELVTFLTLPNATVYGGLGFLTSKTYLNTLLASLNSRDYIRGELDFPISTELSASGRGSEFREVHFAPFESHRQNRNDRSDGSTTVINAPKYQDATENL